MKLLIAVPCMDTMPVQFVNSLVQLDKPCETEIVFTSGSLVYDARNQLTQTAIQSEADAVLWVDSDMTFTPDLAQKLLEDIKSGCDMVAALCFRRKPPFIPVIWKNVAEREIMVEYPSDELFEVDACGFGCVMVKTEVLKATTAVYRKPFCPFDGHGEDVAFCIRAKELGFKLFCDSRVKVGHVGTAIIDEDFFKGWYANARKS